MKHIQRRVKKKIKNRLLWKSYTYFPPQLFLVSVFTQHPSLVLALFQILLKAMVTFTEKEITKRNNQMWFSSLHKYSLGKYLGSHTHRHQQGKGVKG